LLTASSLNAYALRCVGVVGCCWPPTLRQRERGEDSAIPSTARRNPRHHWDEADRAPLRNRDEGFCRVIASEKGGVQVKASSSSRALLERWETGTPELIAALRHAFSKETVGEGALAYVRSGNSVKGPNDAKSRTGHTHTEHRVRTRAQFARRWV